MNRIAVIIFDAAVAIYIVSAIPLIVWTGIGVWRFGVEDWSPFVEQLLYATGNMLEMIAFGLSWLLPVDQVYEQPLYFAGTQLAALALLSLVNKLSVAHSSAELIPCYACRISHGKSRALARQFCVNMYPHILVLIASIVGAISYGDSKWYQFILSISASLLTFYIDVLVIIGVVRLRKIENASKSCNLLFKMACIAIAESAVSHCVSIMIPWLVGQWQIITVYVKDWVSLVLSVAIEVLQYRAMRESWDSLLILAKANDDSFGEYVT